MRRKSRTMQCCKQEDAARIPGEGAPRRVGSVHAGRQTDDQKLRATDNPAWHRCGMVAGIIASHCLTQRHQPWAFGAIDETGFGQWNSYMLRLNRSKVNSQGEQ